MKITHAEYFALDRVVRLAEVTAKVWGLTEIAHREIALARSVVDRLGSKGDPGPEVSAK